MNQDFGGFSGILGAETDPAGFLQDFLEGFFRILPDSSGFLEILWRSLSISGLISAFLSN